MVSPSSNDNPEETRCCLIGACYLTPVADAPVRLGFSVHRIRHDLGAPSRIDVGSLAQDLLF